jgi:pterin-4a-carbinolamine dehydratase
MAFFAQAGALAEKHNHHPEFVSTYTRMRVRLWTCLLYTSDPADDYIPV